jgi:hypothetical protein
MADQTTYLITFDRIGRNHAPSPITVTVPEDDAVAQNIARQVHGHVVSRLMSTAVEVRVELGTAPGTGGHGRIYCGIQSGGSFDVEPLPS